jgi:hypothetical protein
MEWISAVFENKGERKHNMERGLTRPIKELCVGDELLDFAHETLQGLVERDREVHQGSAICTIALKGESDPLDSVVALHLVKMRETFRSPISDAKIFNRSAPCRK